MSRAEKVMILVHPDLRPDHRKAKAGTERDVWTTLNRMGYVTEVLPLRADLTDLDKALARFKPDVVFNLLEEFRGEGVFDFHAVSRLEALGVPCTGCNPRGLIVSRNKFWMSHIALGAGIETPRTFLVGKSGLPSNVRFPAFVKFNREHASLGITKANRVLNRDQAWKVVRRLRERMPGEVLIQEFIPGEDVSVAVFGNQRATVLPPWTLKLRSPNDFATEKVKFSSQLRRRNGIRAIRYQGKYGERVSREALKMFHLLDLNGYARFDFRVTTDGTFLVDVNANPNLARDEDFASSARAAGLGYEQVLVALMKTARAYRPKI